MKSESASSQRSAEPSAAVDKRTLLEALNNFKMDIKQHTDTAVGNVISKLDSLKEEVKSLNNKFNALEECQQSLKSRCDTLEQANGALEKEVRSLQARLNDAEQHSRCANIEVVGVPETPNEDVYAVLQKIATALGLAYRREDVSLAHRLRLYSKKHAHPPIIAQFVSRSVKETWLIAARKKKNLKSTDLSTNLRSSDIYVNDHLTAANKAILGRARRMQRDGFIHFAGYFNGKILVKPREKDAAVRICHQHELDKYEGNTA
jgi:FtsZ-binding cell division protein ZapB